MLDSITPKMVFNSFEGKLPPPGFSSMLYRGSLTGERKRKIADVTLFIVNPEEKLFRREGLDLDPCRIKLQIDYQSTKQAGIVVLDPYSDWVSDERCGVSFRIDGQKGYSYENPWDEVFPDELTGNGLGELNGDNELNIQKCFFIASKLFLPAYVAKESKATSGFEQV